MPAVQTATGASRKRPFVGGPPTSAKGGYRTLAPRPGADVRPSPRGRSTAWAFHSNADLTSNVHPGALRSQRYFGRNGVVALFCSVRMRPMMPSHPSVSPTHSAFI